MVSNTNDVLSSNFLLDGYGLFSIACGTRPHIERILEFCEKERLLYEKSSGMQVFV